MSPVPAEHGNAVGRQHQIHELLCSDRELVLLFCWCYNRLVSGAWLIFSCSPFRLDTERANIQRQNNLAKGPRETFFWPNRKVVDKRVAEQCQTRWAIMEIAAIEKQWKRLSMTCSDEYSSTNCGERRKSFREDNRTVFKDQTRSLKKCWKKSFKMWRKSLKIVLVNNDFLCRKLEKNIFKNFHCVTFFLLFHCIEIEKFSQVKL